MRIGRWEVVAAAAVLAAACVGIWALTHRPPHNLIIFVADGLRSEVVTPQTAPELAEVRSQGVDFRNSHSLYPTVTTPNASAIATGHGLGDTGDFGNMIYVGALPLGLPAFSVVAGVENDPVQAAMNARFGGDYLGETSVLAAARARGWSTAAIGKLGPTSIQDVTARSGDGTIVIDDSTGDTNSTSQGVPAAPDVRAAIKDAGLDTVAPDRGLNGWQGTSIMPGVHVANVEQQNWFAKVATEVLLPRFKAAHRPFVMVFWSRDPDGTQHNQGDSLNSLTPGINGVTSMAAMKLWVSARPKAPWMPWPCCRSVSATSAPQISGWAQPVEKLRKPTTIDGVGVRAEPFSPTALSGRAPRSCRGCMSPMSNSRTGSWRWRPRCCCPASWPRGSRSCWCSGRAIRTARSISRATASTPSPQALTDRPRWRRSATPRTTSGGCGRL